MQARRIVIAAASMLLMLAAAGCTQKPSTPFNAFGDQIALYGTDGTMANAFGEAIKTPGEISGMAGTAALTPLNDGFKARIRKEDPTVEDYNYAGEAYDAVAIVSLAAQVARTTDPKVVSKYINGVTTLDPGGVKCTLISDCFAAIANGKDIAYRGLSVHSGFTSAGEPSTAMYGTEHFDDLNQIDDQKTEFVGTGDPATATNHKSPMAPAPNGVYNGPAFKFGVLLPKTGGLAVNGKPIFAGARLALKDVNAAGGILGKPVESIFSDDGTDVTKSVTEGKKLIADGVNAIIGPATSGGALAFMPFAVAAGVIEFTPSATSAALSAVDDNGLFFRTSPSDLLQAQALADVIMRGGAQKVFIVARDDPYGTGLGKNVSAALTSDGIPAANIQTATYSTKDGADNTATFASIASAIARFHADSVLLIGYAESADMVTAMVKAHMTFEK